ncbi:hypothetical protein ACGFXC_07545 [Streptomyces sp. NPDC048507]|uniref:hypothetical protein n=1 Tax=Streptomyces sp. NPDC048507 TaxID=3365560 RepID=UPI003717CF91
MGRRDHQTSRTPGSGPAYPAAAARADREQASRRPDRPAVRPVPAPLPVPAVPADSGAPGRWRYALHLDRLAAVAAAPGAAGRAGEAAAVAAVLRDPDPVMAESAVVTHLDRRAAGLPPGTEFPDWARALHPVLADHAFPARRLREWTLLKAVAAGGPWSPAELTAASDWCQHTAASSLDAPEALVLLASRARTRRVRNTAAQRLRRRAA